jgi:hypothetical protein
MQIIFSKEDHRYTAGDKVYTSVSKLLSKYKNEFNQEHWSTYKALEILIPDFKTFKKGWNIDSPDFIQYAIQHVDPNLLLIEKNKILDSWGENNLKSINKGNLYHESREAMSYDQGFEINPFNGKKFEITEVQTGDKTNLLKDLYDLKDGFYPELLIWNEDNTIAGQADKVFIETIGDIRYIDIDDYKGLALDTPIATRVSNNPNVVWAQMRNINVGDIVFDGNGYPTRVEHISEIHNNPCYKISFSRGEPIICDHEHKWVITDNEVRDNNLYFTDRVLTTEELYNEKSTLKIKCPVLNNGFLDPSKNCWQDVFITKIEKVPTVDTKCIAVDSPDHTYLAGYNYIKTHNTNRQIKRSAYKNQKMKPPLSHLADCNYIHYNLQISFYAWMLEEFGFRVRDLSFHHFNQMYKLNYLRSEIKAIATK